MANQKLVEIVKRGKTTIARWRHKNPDLLMDLVDAKLVQANLRGANLRRAHLLGADLRGAELAAAQLNGAEMTRADLRKADARKVDFSRATLFMATLREAFLSGANLRQANLNKCELNQVDLTNAELVSATLRDAMLNGAVLVGADLSKSDLTGADFDGAVFGWTSLGNVDLSNVKGLDSVVHVGPSTVGVDTLFRSQGKISDVFLRGCGLPEELVLGLPALTKNSFESGTCFIRYCHEEESFAVRLYEALQEEGIRCWLDEKPKLPADVPYKDVARGFRVQDKVVLCASKYSLSSWWSSDEIEAAFDKEQQFKKEQSREIRVLFPINLDGFMFSGDWKFKKEKQVANRLTADFTGWRRNATKFDEELRKLIQALSGESK